MGDAYVSDSVTVSGFTGLSDSFSVTEPRVSMPGSEMLTVGGGGAVTVTVFVV